MEIEEQGIVPTPSFFVLIGGICKSEGNPRTSFLLKFVIFNNQFGGFANYSATRVQCTRWCHKFLNYICNLDFF